MDTMNCDVCIFWINSMFKSWYKVEAKEVSSMNDYMNGWEDIDFSVCN